MNSSMKVPLVVNTAISTNADIATDGPASQSHQETPRKPAPVSASGPFETPTAPSATCTMPRGSLNQLGAATPIADMIWLTGPANENRNSHSTVIATELVTDGK